MGPPTISYLVPVHNEELVLADTAKAIAARLEEHPGSEVILVENGSTDRSPELVEDLAATLSGPEVRVIAARSAKGYGNAMRHGIDLASGELLVITAADLPFGFSDLDEGLTFDCRPALMIGSKAHPSSLVEISTQRRTMSAAFRLLRRMALDLNVGDSQGTILVDRALAQRIRPHLASADFFFSTELVALAARSGVEPVELPVDYSQPRPGSTVRPVRDGLRMARQVLELRARLRHVQWAEDS